MSSVDLFELYLSVQGESTHAGRPCVFVRLAGCNLSCEYCDSEEAAKGTGEITQVNSILDRVKEFGTGLVEITGGEPLGQPGTAELIRLLADEGLEVLVETNGTVDLAQFDRRASYIVDIKTPGSGAGKTFMESNFSCLTERDEVKFVVVSRDDFDWAVELCRERKLCGNLTVLFSPAWGRVAPKDLAQWLLDSRLDARLNLQTHKYIWGATARKV